MLLAALRCAALRRTLLCCDALCCVTLGYAVSRCAVLCRFCSPCLDDRWSQAQSWQQLLLKHMTEGPVAQIVCETCMSGSAHTAHLCHQQ